MSSSGGSSNKKNKKIYLKRLGAEKRKYKNILQPGLKGFICISSNNEAKCVREAYNLLSEYDKKLSANAVTEDTCGKTDGEVDFCSAVAAEVEAMKEKGQPYPQVMTKVKHVLFFKSNAELPPPQFLYNILLDIAQSRATKSQALIRILPVEMTVSVSEENILNGVRKLICEHFSENGITFNVLAKVRNNSSLDVKSLTKKATQLIKDAHPKNECLAKRPELTLLIEVLCRTCCLGVAPDYTALRKYNLKELADGGTLSDENRQLLKSKYGLM